MLFPSLAAPVDRPALRVGDRTLTYRELAGACAYHAGRLAAAGIAPGDRVGVWTHPTLETLVAFVAHAAAGYVSVPLDPKLGERELAHVLTDAAPKQIVRPTNVGRAAMPEALRSSIDLELGDAPVPAWPQVRGVPALVLYTSGTTGAPKGALITDANIAANLDALARAWAWTADDTVVHALPMFHVHGLVLGLFGSIRRGGTLHWVPKFSPEALAAAMSPGCMLFAVPTMYHRLCESRAIEAFCGARLLVSGSAPLSARDHQRIEALTGQRPVERYGLTETLINCSTLPAGDRRAGFVGPPLDNVELRLTSDGEIQVRGPNVFAGYLNRHDAPIVDGWFSTGDIGEIVDGQVRIIGRSSTDIIKCGGFKVGAGEVEGALCDHAAVAQAAVVGAPDPDLGEAIVAFVVVRAPVDPAALIQHVADSLSPHKRPRHVRFVDELPRNAMGKVQKKKLKEML